MDLAPKETELNKNLNSKSKRTKQRNGKSLKSSVTGEQADEIRMHDEEVDLAMQIDMQKQKQSEEIILK
jgi:hypothetical protein